MSGNFFGDFAGITNKTRVRKPPGGGTSDIFGLEARQNSSGQQMDDVNTSEKKDQGSKYDNIRDEAALKDDRYKEQSTGSADTLYFVGDHNKTSPMHCHQVHSVYNTIPNEKLEFVQSNLKNHEHDIPLAGGKEYAGLTNKTRVRKPPGGDTHDIFGMEGRQQEERQAEERRQNSNHFDGSCGYAGIGSSTNVTNKTKTGQLNLEQQLLLQKDKENINLLSEEGSEEKAILKQKSLGEEDDNSKLPSAKVYLTRNPITGEVTERRVTTSYKLADRSNVVMQKPEENRTTVRVRQPPGGVSSFIF